MNERYGLDCEVCMRRRIYRLGSMFGETRVRIHGMCLWRGKAVDMLLSWLKILNLKRKVSP